MPGVDLTCEQSTVCSSWTLCSECDQDQCLQWRLTATKNWCDIGESVLALVVLKNRCDIGGSVLALAILKNRCDIGQSVFALAILKNQCDIAGTTLKNQVWGDWNSSWLSWRIGDMAGTVLAIAEQDCWGIYRTVKPLETYIYPQAACEGQGSELCSWLHFVGVGRQWMLLRVKWLDSAYDLWSVLPVAHCGSINKQKNNNKKQLTGTSFSCTALDMHTIVTKLNHTGTVFSVFSLFLCIPLDTF